MFTTVRPLAALLLATTPALALQDIPTTAQDPQIPADTEIVTTESGLQYSVLQPGQGEKAHYGDRVRMHYTGWTTDGKMFDSSRKRGVPYDFSVGRRVIEGWTEAAQLMNPGARLKLTIPAALAYGEQGRPPRIPGDATLIFDVEMVSIAQRTLGYVAWDDTKESTTTNSGARMQTLVAGEGDKGGEVDYAVVEWAVWSPEGELLSSSVLEQQTLALNPKVIPFAFISEAIKDTQAGGRVLMEVPQIVGAEALDRLRVKTEAAKTIWQFELALALKFDKPEFVMPAAEDLTTTESGLQYQILREGNGSSPTVQNQVECHYCGWLTDGTQFDASYDRGQPITFSLGGVIAGWTEGLQLMKEGGKAVFVIPGGLGYGERGSPPKIGPNATLVFVVELLRVR